MKVYDVLGCDKTNKIGDAALSRFIIKISDLDDRIDEDSMEEALEEARERQKAAQ